MDNTENKKPESLTLAQKIGIGAVTAVSPFVGEAVEDVYAAQPNPPTPIVAPSYVPTGDAVKDFARELEIAKRARSQYAYTGVIETGYRQAVRNAKGDAATLKEIKKMRDDALGRAHLYWTGSQVQEPKKKNMPAPAKSPLRRGPVIRGR